MYPILAQTTPYTADGQYSLAENAVYLTTGFIIVIGALSVLWAICWGMGQIFIRKAEAAARAKEAARQETAAAPAGSEQADPALIAVIAAAVQVTLHRPMRIRSVRSAHHPTSNESRHNAWATEGRSTHFQSHKVR